MFRLFTQRASFFAKRSFSTITKRKSLTYSLPLAIGISSLSFSTPLLLDSKQPHDENNSVRVDSNLSPFPLEISKPDQFQEDFKLIGHGVRTVTFLHMRVYAIGIYIAQRDIPKATKILTELGAEKLNTPTESEEIVTKLLENDIKFLARISPIRDTDFNHLRDGLIRSILAHPKSKGYGDELTTALDQFREIFRGRRDSVPKNHLLCLETRTGGKLSLSYVNTMTKEVVPMGIVEQPLVSKQLFLQYLSGVKPLSEPLRKSCVHGLLAL
ncbi:Altered inheritance of mitochondria protein 18 mitochondrial [Spathaspora sp. JA1]|nr:Altered inheritance of mitochondria protein 18 mitochondrial [Spathaspora sp. JA1]